MEGGKLSHKFKEFQSAICTVNKGLKTSSSPGYSNRTSRVYHVEFPHILKEVEVKTVQFFSGDCM